MKRKGKVPFDPKVFLSKVNGGRTISDYRKDQIVYRQGDPADSAFFIQSGKVKKTASSGSSPVAAAPSFPRRRAGRAWSPFRSSVLSFCKSEQFCTDANSSARERLLQVS
jgi:Cyclic nucleotide-binding domain